MTKRTPRQIARSKGELIYVGQCRHHGKTLKYVSGNCVACSAIRPWSDKTEAQRRHIAEMARKRRAKWRAANPSKWKQARQKARRARDKARAAGRFYYFGMPCKHGHPGKRYVAGGGRVDCGHKPYSAMSPTEKAKLLKRQRQDKRRQALALKVLQNLGVKIFPEETPYELSNRT
jgi:hypothetical protein